MQTRLLKVTHVFMRYQNLTNGVFKKRISAYAPANIVLLTRGFCGKAGFCKIIQEMYY